MSWNHWGDHPCVPPGPAGQNQALASTLRASRAAAPRPSYWGVAGDDPGGPRGQAPSAGGRILCPGARAPALLPTRPLSAGRLLCAAGHHSSAQEVLFVKAQRDRSVLRTSAVWQVSREPWGP